MMAKMAVIMISPHSSILISAAIKLFTAWPLTKLGQQIIAEKRFLPG
jgi:ABC-type Fe3+ transport system substrate-binding protein